MCLFCLGASKKWRWDRSFSIFYMETQRGGAALEGCCCARTVPCRDEPFSLSAASCACTQDLVTSSVPTHRLSAVPCSQNHGAARPAAQRSHTEGVSGSTRTACYPASQPHTQANAHTYRGLGLDHLVAELIWVSERRTQPQGLQAVLLAMVRHRSLLVVLLLLQQPQLGPRMGLGTLPMFPPRGGVLPSGHGGCAGGVCGAGVCSGTTGGGGAVGCHSQALPVPKPLVVWNTCFNGVGDRHGGGKRGPLGSTAAPFLSVACATGAGRVTRVS